jgi:hypothetical protein
MQHHVMDSGSGLRRALAGAFICTVLVACGGGSEPPPVPQAATAEPADDDDAFGICRLLTAEQVASVLPGSDPGMASSGGGSLIEGVDAHQCAYTAARDGELDLLTLVVTVASTDVLFAQIEPSGSAFDEDDAVAVGDGGWKKDDQSGEFAVVAKQGRSVLRLELLSADAGTRGPQLIELARAVAAKL